MPEDIKWHFIGGLQSNKAKMLVNNVKGLYMGKLQGGCLRSRRAGGQKTHNVEDSRPYSRVVAGAHAYAKY